MGGKTEVESTPKRRITIVNNTMPVPKDEKTLVDLNYEYETGSGRVIVDPAEAEVEVIHQLPSIQYLKDNTCDKMIHVD
jgi:hypothetical protein